MTWVFQTLPVNILQKPVVTSVIPDLCCLNKSHKLRLIFSLAMSCLLVTLSLCGNAVLSAGWFLNWVLPQNCSLPKNNCRHLVHQWITILKLVYKPLQSYFTNLKWMAVWKEEKSLQISEIISLKTIVSNVKFVWFCKWTELRVWFRILFCTDLELEEKMNSSHQPANRVFGKNKTGNRFFPIHYPVILKTKLLLDD